MVEFFKIYGTDNSSTNPQRDESKLFTAAINPENFSKKNSVELSKKSVLGGQGSGRYVRTNAENYTVDLILDGTGVVPNSGSVTSQLDSLYAIAYTYDGTKHQTPIVFVNWSKIVMNAHVTAVDVSYTRFKTTGEPLRAKVKISFTEYKSAEQIAREENKQSPDLTHIVEVKAGDTLPFLCHKIYQNSAYYLQAARINGLTNFRNLVPGTKLRFPPLA